jgi:GTP pyrophosphokinase
MHFFEKQYRPMIDEAAELSREAHSGQERNFSGNPYHVHSTRVAALLRQNDASEEQIAAGYLHDTIEDTDVEYEQLLEQFGKEVANIVLEMTNDGEMIDRFGKTDYMKRKLVSMSDEALTVKLADRYDNTSDLQATPESFRSRYAESTAAVLDYLVEERNLTEMHKRLINLIRENIQNAN